jgi:hypothetical protein
LPEIRKKLQASPHVLAVFLSPTGDGLKAIVRVPADVSTHAGSFRAVQKHVRELTGVEIDQSCKDPARLCYMSYDPEIYVNESAVELEPLPEPEKPKALSTGVVNLSDRQRIACELLGAVDWQSGTSGFVPCPGKHLHTTGDGERDCCVDFDGVPTVHCFHNSCRGILSGVNRELRSRIGKAEHAKPETPKIEAPGDVRPIELPPPPASYVPPPLALLPSQLQEYIHAAAESLSVDESFILLPLLSALGSAIGDARSILLKRGFIQPPIIWTGIIGRSGARKSPTLDVGCSGVMKHERELIEQNRQDREAYENELAQWQANKPKDRGLKPEAHAILTCVMDDLTIEALTDVLIANPRGVLIRKDELSHWLASFDQYKSHAKGSDVSRWLSLHTGVFLAVDRRSDNRHHRIWQPRVCITGGIQPKVLLRALTEDFFERGLPARFLFAYPPFRQDLWSEATVADDLRMAMLELFEELWLLQPEHDENEHSKPSLLPLGADAKSVFTAFYDECGASAVGSGEHEEAAWCKLTGYSARLALVGQLAHNPQAEVSTGDVMQAACELARWFGNEAVRIYALLAETREQREQRELIEFIERRLGAVYEREVMQSFTRLKNNKLGTARELTALVKAGLGEWEPVSPTIKGGRPTRKFRLLRSSTSTQPLNVRGETGSSVDVDSSSSQKNTPSREPDTEVETLVGDELGVGRL